MSSDASPQTKKELIVYGYTRQIQKIFNDSDSDKIIPASIINVCFQFYSVRVYTFMLTTNTHKNEFISFNIDTNVTHEISPKNNRDKTINKCSISSLCHIPKISNLFRSNKLSSNRRYDAFICRGQDKYHYLLIYEAKQLSLGYDVFRSNKNDGDNVSKYIFCGQYGIYTHHGQENLRQVNLSDFDYIQDSDDASHGRYRSSSIPSADKEFAYMVNKDSVFWIETSWMKGSWSYGIYNMNDKEFISIGQRSNISGMGICYNDIDGSIYLLSNTEKISGYDTNEKKWVGVNKSRNYNRMYQNKPLLWCDATILYYAAFKDSDEPIFRYYDLREDDEWRNCDMNHVLKSKGRQFFC